MDSVSRRGVLRGAAAAGAVAAIPTGLVAAATPAEAAYLPRARMYRKTPVANKATRHLLRRFSYGLTPRLRKQVRRAGGYEAWFRQQLRPRRIEDGQAKALRSWFPTLDMSPQTLWKKSLNGELTGYDVGSAYLRWTLLRRTYSQRQLQEVMTEFWMNHFHIYPRGASTWLFRSGYDQAIRKHALGRFDQLLEAVVLHPAMLMFLDGDLSEVRRAVRRNGDIEYIDKLNENLGRELLELHTVGRETNYTEKDVRNSARLLTGWQIDRAASWRVTYEHDKHYVGEVSVMGFGHPNRYRQGRDAQARYLRYLAHHPATARRIVRKLAVRFVSDTPSESLVQHLEGVFLKSGTSIPDTLNALIAHPEFKRNYGSKVRTPSEDMVAAYRVLGVQFQRPRRRTDAANAVLMQARQCGQEPFGWERPDGFPDANAVWSSTSRMLGSLRVHHALGGGYWPTGNVTYRDPGSWLPERRIRFDELVDHLCRVVLGRPSTSRILGAACIVGQARPRDVVTADHPVVRYRMGRILTMLLDTPQHMNR